MADTPPPALSATELEVLRLVATGATNREIARARGITEATVKKHLTNIYAKLDTGNRTEAVRRALERGLVVVETPAPVDDSGPGDLGRQAAVHLAQELERVRHRSRRTVQAVVLLAGLAVAAAAAAGYGYVDRRAVPTPVPTRASLPPGTWFPSINLPTARTGPAAAVDPEDGAVLAIGGLSESGVLAETLRLGPADVRWRRLADKPTPVESAAAVTLGGEVLVPGGCGSDGRAVRVVEILAARDGTWRSGPPLPEPACGYGLAKLEGQIYLFGGRSGPDSASASDAVWVLDGAGWEARDRMPFPRADLAAVVVGNTIHLLGGRDRVGRPQVSHWVYRPWETSPDARWDADGGPVLPEGRAGLSAAVTEVRNVYVVGGGWDRRLDDGTLLLRPGGQSWEPQHGSRAGPTPQRGAGLVVVEGRLLALLGGTVDGRPSDRHYRWEVVPSTLIFPGSGGVR